jgi:myo-inositol-1(or 4)-monophosphatase
MQDLKTHLEAGLAAVIEAGDIALEYFRQPMTVTDKLPGVVYDPVTEADQRIEALIRERLAAQFPAYGIVGEEYGNSGSGDTYWIIDPIDGTRAFISGMPSWGILLGLVVEGKATIGLMHQPFTGETYFAAPEYGTRFRHQGREQKLSTRTEATLADAILYSTHPTMFAQAGLMPQYEALASQCRLQRWGGDCYGFALLAYGCIDLMIESLLMPYDIVPLIPIIEGAGGVVTDLEGHSPMQGGTVIAAANATLQAAAIEILQRTTNE